MLKIKCQFGRDTFSDISYACKILSEVINEDEPLEFEGKHDVGKSNEAVKEVTFEHCNMKKVPQGLKKLFPNFEILIISYSGLENVTRGDLAEYKNLKKIDFSNNKFEFLPGDLFEDFENLEEIYFDDNQLTVIEPEILDKLDKLKYASFDYNPNYTSSVNCNNKQALIDFKEELIEKFLADSESVKKYLKKSIEEKQKLKTELKFEKEKNSYITSKYQKCIHSDIEAFIQDKSTKDFQIQIDDHEFPVHKFLLAARSPTLAEILKNNPEVENLNLVDISVEIFEIILKFLYTDELPGDDETNFLHLFAAAGKLKIENLKDFAAKNLFDQIDSENAMEILNLSNKYEHEGLKVKAFNEIKKKYITINFKDDWASDTEKVVNIIEAFHKKEDVIKKAEEEFQSLLV